MRAYATRGDATVRGALAGRCPTMEEAVAAAPPPGDRHAPKTRDAGLIATGRHDPCATRIPPVRRASPRPRKTAGVARSPADSWGQNDPKPPVFPKKATSPARYRPWAAGSLADCRRSESIGSMGCGIIVDNSRAAPPGCARRATGRFRGHENPRYPPTTTRKAHDGTHDRH